MPMSVKSHSAPQMRSRLLQQLLEMGFRVRHPMTLSSRVSEFVRKTKGTNSMQ